MSKGSKILLGVVSAWPPIYIVVFMGAAFYSVFARGAEPPALWAIIIPLHFLTILLSIGLMIFYIVNVFRNEGVNKDMKVLWAVVLLMGAIIAMPIYWYLYIWRTKSAAEPGMLQAGSFQGAGAGLPRETNVGNKQRYEPPDWR